MDGEQPTRVPDDVVAEIRSRERNGFVELPKPRGLAPGMRVRVTSGPLHDQIGLLASLRPRERVLVLLHLLGRLAAPGCSRLGSHWDRCGVHYVEPIEGAR